LIPFSHVFSKRIKKILKLKKRRNKFRERKKKESRETIFGGFKKVERKCVHEKKETKKQIFFFKYSYIN
jgi:hypothetical protein